MYLELFQERVFQLYEEGNVDCNSEKHLAGLICVQPHSFCLQHIFQNGLLKLLFPVFLPALQLYNKGGMQHVKDTLSTIHQYWLVINYWEEKIAQISPIIWKPELQEKESGDLLIADSWVTLSLGWCWLFFCPFRYFLDFNRSVMVAESWHPSAWEVQILYSLRILWEATSVSTQML